MMEKPPQMDSCFYSVCGNTAQFKEAPSLRRPIVLNGRHPKAALLFPPFYPATTDVTKLERHTTGAVSPRKNNGTP